MPAVKTYYDPKPIPLRQYDWEAIDDNYEPGEPIGYGATEEEALADYATQQAEAEDARVWRALHPQAS